MKLRAILWLLLSLLLVSPLLAQAPTTAPERFGAAGMGYFSQAVPNIQGWAALGLPLTNDGKALSYTDFDVSIVKTAGQISVAGFQLRYTMRTGLAYRIYATGSWALYGLAAPGFSADGNNFAASFEYGGFIHKDVGKGWGVLGALTREQYGSTVDLAPRLGITKKF